MKIIINSLNFLIFQWFFIRIKKITEKRIESYKLISCDLMSNGNVLLNGRGTINEYQYYLIQFWVLPCTGFFYLKNVFIHKEKSIKFNKWI